MKVTTAAEMRLVEEKAAAQGLTSIVLMETAGHALAQAVLRHAASPRPRVLVLAGPGQNGGDGLTAARHLLGSGAEVHVWLIADPERLRGAAKEQWLRVQGSARVAWNLSSGTPPGRFDAAIDAMFGTSLARDLAGDAARAVAYLAATGVPVVAADLPSGVHADTGRLAGTAVRASCTVALGALKPGHLFWPGRDYCGEIVLEPLGLLPDLLDDVGMERIDRLSPADAAPTSGKGAYGRTVIVAGSAHYPGAAWLAARGALRGGSGLTVLASVDQVLRHAAALPEVIARQLQARGTTGVIDAAALDAETFRDASAVVIGPGLDRMDDAGQAAWLDLYVGLHRPLVLDADGLRPVLGRIGLLRRRPGPTVLTPHVGEASRLLGRSVADDAPARLRAAREIAERSGAVVLLKGHPTFVAAPWGRVAVIEGGGPELATGGTGDVLSGALGAQLAQGSSARDAAERAAWAHAQAGALFRRRQPRGGLASEIADLLPLPLGGYADA